MESIDWNIAMCAEIGNKFSKEVRDEIPRLVVQKVMEDLELQGGFMEYKGVHMGFVRDDTTILITSIEEVFEQLRMNDIQIKFTLSDVERGKWSQGGPIFR